MNSAPQSRIALAVIATAIVMSMIWIFSDISSELSATSEPVWRYTSQGWKELAELTPPPQQSPPGVLDNVSPLVWGAIQLLAGLAILIAFAEDSVTSMSRKRIGSS
jgi:hypothetical protein